MAWIRKKFDVAVFSAEDAGESVPVEETEFWKEMEKNRIGNLLAGARLKAGLTQTRLAERVGVRQNMISDFERGRRPLSPAMAKRLSKALKVEPSLLTAGGEPGH
ncbi:MAG: helix-turn-helix transcriptional regulator [Candidatus Sumerlaeota bacterium]|nr:helix-turn-helix transcriptional regulator [Candidatus Sumerlaeota bacterium]